MCKFDMFITAVCVLFVIKLQWPKNKSIYDSEIDFVEGQYGLANSAGGQKKNI